VRVALVVLSLCALVAGAASLSPAGAQSSGRVVDRSFLCTTSLSGGIYEIEVRGHTGARAGKRWAQLPFAAVSSGNPTIWGDLLRPDTLAFVTAGRPTSGTTIDQEVRKSGALYPGRIAVNMRACRPTTRSIPLTRAGLEGGTASTFGDEFDCEVPRRMLLRVRAVLTRPDSFKRIRGFERLSAPVREAQLTARTEKGRTVMHAQVAASGRTTIHTATGMCFPD
jgi:hypothetical protein